MIASLLITFRETLEAALVIGVIIGYLKKTNQTKHIKSVWQGVILGIIGSLIGAIIFTKFAGGLTGKTEEIFEGITMLIGAGLLTTMIFWMIKQEGMAKKITNKISTNMTKYPEYGLVILAFFAILREGIESVIFVYSANYISNTTNIFGAIIGILLAIIISILIFKAIIKFKLKLFFKITNIMLILFAAGLVAHGIHELHEAQIIPTIIEHIYDINPNILSDGTYPALHEKGSIGSLLSSLVGYNGNPSLVESASYLLYWILISFYWYKSKNK